MIEEDQKQQHTYLVDMDFHFQQELKELQVIYGNTTLPVTHGRTLEDMQ